MIIIIRIPDYSDRYSDINIREYGGLFLKDIFAAVMVYPELGCFFFSL